MLGPEDISLFVAPEVVAIYPLSRIHRGRDVSGRRNPTGRLGRVGFAKGPDGRKDSSTQFYGNSYSYIEIPNRGKLDARKSITILAWVYHSGRAGPIVNYRAGKGWGVHLWLTSPRTIYVRFVRRDGKFTKGLFGMRGRLPYKVWNYIGATYNYKTGYAKIWVNSRVVAYKRLGRFRIATQYPIRIGSRRGDRRHFKGRISCIQIYSRALRAAEIRAARKRCFSKY